MAVKIAIANHKGGVGKTTSTASIGAALALKGHKVLLIDADPQSSLSERFGKEESETIKVTLYESLFDLNTDGTESKKLVPLPVYSIKENLSIVSSSLELTVFDTKAPRIGGEKMLKEKIDKISSNYDYILIDCAPSFGLLTMNALIAADYVLLPLINEIQCFKALKIFKGTLVIVRRANKKLKVLGAFDSKSKGNALVTKAIDAEYRNGFKAAFGEEMFDTKIRESIKVVESEVREQDIFEYSPNSTTAKDYMSLTEEIIERLNK